MSSRKKIATQISKQLSRDARESIEKLTSIMETWEVVDVTVRIRKKDSDA